MKGLTVFASLTAGGCGTQSSKRLSMFIPIRYLHLKTRPGAATRNALTARARILLPGRGPPGVYGDDPKRVIPVFERALQDGAEAFHPAPNPAHPC